MFCLGRTISGNVSEEGVKNAEMVRVLQGALQVPPVDPALKFAFCTRAFGRSVDFEKAATN
jgi:hypothetical protein